MLVHDDPFGVMMCHVHCENGYVASPGERLPSETQTSQIGAARSARVPVHFLRSALSTKR